MSSSSAARVDLVSQYGWLANVVAIDIAARLPVHVDIDDLKQNGFVGLMDAVRKFSPDRGIPFEAYAKFRIRGAILDGLRELDWASRHTRRLQKQISSVLTGLTIELGRPPDLSEIAERLGLDSAEAGRRMRIAALDSGNVSGSTRTDEELPPPEFKGDAKDAPDAICAHRELQAAIGRAMAVLPKRYRRVMQLYHFDGLQMKKIGKLMGVNESRISQIRTRALRRMREALLAEGISSAAELIWHSK